MATSSTKLRCGLVIDSLTKIFDSLAINKLVYKLMYHTFITFKRRYYLNQLEMIWENLFYNLKKVLPKD